MHSPSQNSPNLLAVTHCKYLKLFNPIAENQKCELTASENIGREGMSLSAFPSEAAVLQDCCALKSIQRMLGQGALAEREDLESNLLHGSAITFVVGVFG
jgi:hypothetical protein